MRLKMMSSGNSIDYDSLTATTADVPEGVIFIGRGSDEEQVGELPNMEKMQDSPGYSESKADVPVHHAVMVAETVDTNGNDQIVMVPPLGKYPGNERAWIGCYPSDIGIKAEVIAAGHSIGNTHGTYGADSNMTDNDLRAGKIGYGANGRIAGGASDYGAILKTLAAGESYTINKGFYSAGKVTAKDLASQTEGTAKNEDIIKDKTATVNGKEVIGTMPELTDGATIEYSSNNGTKVIAGDACWQQKNTDGVERLLIRYNGEKGRIRPNTLFGIPLNLLRAAIGYTDASKVLADTTIAGKKGTMVDRGAAQYGGFGEGDTYYAINKLPEGYYHSYDYEWAPEARIDKNTLRAYLGITADKIVSGKNIADVNGTALYGVSLAKTICDGTYNFSDNSYSFTDNVVDGAFGTSYEGSEYPYVILQFGIKIGGDWTKFPVWYCPGKGASRAFKLSTGSSIFSSSHVCLVVARNAAGMISWKFLKGVSYGTFGFKMVLTMGTNAKPVNWD